MKILFINMIFILFSFNCASLSSSVNKNSTNISNGFYYGKNSGFFPQNMVFIKIDKEVAHVNCYLPMKGQYFITINDTLTIKGDNKSLYVSSKSKVYLEDGKIFFETLKKINDTIDTKTEITYQPDKNNLFKEIKEKATPYIDDAKMSNK